MYVTGKKLIRKYMLQFQVDELLGRATTVYRRSSYAVRQSKAARIPHEYCSSHICPNPNRLNPMQALVCVSAGSCADQVLHSGISCRQQRRLKRAGEILL